MKKLLSAGLLLLFATSSCIFVVSDSDDCAYCKAKANAESSHHQDDNDGDAIEYTDER